MTRATGAGLAAEQHFHPADRWLFEERARRKWIVAGRRATAAASKPAVKQY